MKKTGILMALMLFFSVSVSAVDYEIGSRKDLPDANIDGSIDIPKKLAKPGDSVTVYTDPGDGYGLSRGVFYAVKDKNGVFSEVLSADNKSKHRDDRANRQTFKFKMPEGNVEVWAYFAPVRTLMIHQPEQGSGELKPLYGFKKSDYTKAWNLPLQPIRLEIKPSTGYELVDINLVNLDRSYCQRDSNILTVYMPNKDETVHITPIFGKNKYNVTTSGNLSQTEVTFSNYAPKSRDEVDVILLCNKGFIPTGISITGCKSWWRVGKPQLQDDGRWKVVYRFKVDFDNVNIEVNHEQVHSIVVNDTKDSKRVQTLLPEMIPDFPGVARKGQQVPILFRMPDNYNATFTAKDGNKTLTPLIYHNAIQNSFADQDMADWTESDDYMNNGLPLTVETDSANNKYWRTSVKNSFSQMVSLKGRTFPSHAYIKDKNKSKLNFAAIASINPRYGRTASINVKAMGQGVSDNVLVADLKNKPDGWQTVFKTASIDAQADTLQFIVNAEAENADRKRSYDGPMFDDLCLLLPTEGKTILNEDLLIFTMGDQNVTINYTPSAKLNTLSVEQKEHATVTLTNITTGEQGDSVKAMANDVIMAKGKYDEGHAIYEMQFIQDNERYNIRLDSINTATREVSYRFIMREDQDAIITPVVDTLKVNIKKQYGGVLKVDNEYALQGAKVLVTVNPNPGCQLKQIRTIPDGIVTIKADQVDAATGAGTYSFVMPTGYVSLIPEYIVPITKAEQLDSLDEQYGEFRLERDINLGDEWVSQNSLYGYFNGNGHRITYSGNQCLFFNVYSGAAVRHLYVNATLEGKKPYMGAITQYNEGIIEDCEVNATIRNKKMDSYAAGVAGQNGPNGGVISHCHVLCEVIDAKTACGITYQEEGGTVRDNVFNGQFAKNDGYAYMICNDRNNSTVQGNSYIPNDGNARAVVGSGVTEALPVQLVDAANNMKETYPVFAASIRNKYNAYTIATLLPDSVTLDDLSATTAGEGTLVSGTVSVSTNKHLESITISAPDGSDSKNCTFTGNTQNRYYFSFTMPDHDVLITFKTQVGTLIYTAKQLEGIHDKKGLYYLAADLHLNNWNKKVNLKGSFYGNGHTIYYNTSGDFKGLFYKIKKDALLEGLRVIGYAESDMNCGGIVFENYGTIRNCHFSGRITRLSADSMSRVSALAYKLVGKASKIDHCSATGELISPYNQAAVDNNPLCTLKDANITNSYWINPSQTDKHQELLNFANASRNDYPVCAQGVFDLLTPRLIVGTDTIVVQNGQTINEITIVDGEPFICTNDVKVNRIFYKRQAMDNLEQWILPFEFNLIAGSGTFEYHKIVEKGEGDEKIPDVGPGTTLSLSRKSSSVNYKANEPWMVKNARSDDNTYVLTNAEGPITIKATHNGHVLQYASITDIGDIYNTYEGIPALTAREDIMYVWNSAKQAFARSDADDIKPCSYYLQFYSKTDKKIEAYENTQWAKNEEKSSKKASSVARRLASVMEDGWQPVFLDPRNPQSVTPRMLDNYEVACLADIQTESPDEDTDASVTAVSLVYQMVDSPMELPAALPLLVRPKRSDVQPLVDEKTGVELDSLITLSMMQMLMEDENEDEDEDADSLIFEMPHYWCASFGNRLDIWPLPAPERYADLSYFGCMMFTDNYFDQSFTYASNTDTSVTAPMSYCITVLNTDKYELLPLMGNRVNVVFLEPIETTDISLTPSPSPKGEGSGYIYNLNGQRVGASYKGIILQNGRKIYKR